jgi:hypothetical protein
MSIIDEGEQWLVSVALKKAVVSIVQVTVAWLLAHGAVEWLAANGAEGMTATTLTNLLTAVLTGGFKVGRNFLKVKFGIQWLLVPICAVLMTGSAQAFNPITDVQDNLKWTLGEEALLGTAYKIGGSGSFNIGQRGDSVMFGIFDYRFIKQSYGAISNPQNGEKVGDGLKTGLMLNYFLNWFKSPQTPAMALLSNVNIGPSITFPLFSEPKPLKYPSIWLEANYRFGPSATPAK